MTPRPQLTPVPPCRLHGLLAREAPRGVLLRRGPRHWTQLIAWDTGSDSFTPGQWVRASAYPRRCDLSTDGELLLYHTRRGFNVCFGQQLGLTAISRPPYWTALHVWGPYDTDEPVAMGGGFFTGERSLCVRECTGLPRLGTADLAEGHRAGPLLARSFDVVQSFRLLRAEAQGWTLQSPLRDSIDFRTHPTGAAPWVFERKNPTDRRILRREERGGAASSTSRGDDWAWFGNARGELFTVLDAGQSVTLPPDVEWADWDQQGRLVFTRQGKLFSLTRRRGAALLADFNGSAPARLPPPDWVSSWEPPDLAYARRVPEPPVPRPRRPRHGERR